MITWNNLDTLTSYQELEKTARVNLAEVMTGEKGAERVKKYSVPMAEGLVYHYAAKQVDDTVLDALKKLADEAQLAEKFKALYNGEVINTGEKRLVLHHMTRGQLGDAVIADGVIARYLMTKEPGKYKIVDGTDYGVDNFAVGFRKDDTALRDKINGILADMKKDGTADKIVEKWLGSSADLDKSDAK